MKKNKISKNWLIKKHRDQFFKQSRIQGYRSRSAFKLIEMNKKFRFLNNKTYLLDLGSSPGGWSQVASYEISKGKILAVDIKSMKKIGSKNTNIEAIIGPCINVKNYEVDEVLYRKFTKSNKQYKKFFITNH